MHAYLYKISFGGKNRITWLENLSHMFSVILRVQCICMCVCAHVCSINYETHVCVRRPLIASTTRQHACTHTYVHSCIDTHAGSLPLMITFICIHARTKCLCMYVFLYVCVEGLASHTRFHIKPGRSIAL